jgi:hypothetical protein
MTEFFRDFSQSRQPFDGIVPQTGFLHPSSSLFTTSDHSMLHVLRYWQRR